MVYNGIMTEAEKTALRSAAKILGSMGGRKRNPLKGFGTGDNARKAVNARWEKYRALKCATSKK